jgi:hypothetical protein
MSNAGAAEPIVSISWALATQLNGPFWMQSKATRTNTLGVMRFMIPFLTYIFQQNDCVGCWDKVVNRGPIIEQGNPISPEPEDQERFKQYANKSMDF